ncbi:MAG: rod shape-determining protein RodA [Bacteroidales bacterium]|nr:rod shape-determining protein RodA [Bacteroidales bacterium]
MAISSTYKKIDYTPIVLYAIIVLFGWLNIFAACHTEAHAEVFDLSVQHGKQMIWIVISAIFATLILFSEARIYSNGAYIFYIGVLLMLILTLAIGKSTNGGVSWIEIGPIKIQMSEFSKFATALVLAKYLSGQDVDIAERKTWGTILLLLGLPAALIFLQHDTGSTLVFASFLIPLYRIGMPPLIFSIGFIAVALFVGATSEIFGRFTNYILCGLVLLGCLFYLFIYLGKPKTKDYVKAIAALLICCGFVFSVDYIFDHVLEPHQQNRIKVLYDPTLDLQGKGYNVHQAKIAIGSGGLTGKGALKGTITPAHFVPEQETDFIFCTVGEEWGFLGSMALVLLYTWLLQHLITMAERQASLFARFYGYCVASILFFHFMVNIGMVLGLLPVIGIPLPFFSYGGSSLLAFTILLFIFIRLDANHMSLL